MNRDIIYVSSLCSKRTQDSLMNIDSKAVGLQVQKYHRLLVKGLISNGANVSVLSYHPGLGKIHLTPTYCENEDGIDYRYLKVNDTTPFRHIIVIIKSFVAVLYSLVKSKNAVVVCDVLNASVSMGAIAATKMMKRLSIGIITDFPGELNGEKNVLTSIVWNNIKKCSAYMVLTEQMKDKLNPNKKYIVLEGHVDSAMSNQNNAIENKSFPKSCLYAGLLHKKYGIAMLIDAFIKANVENWVLDIYGYGDYLDEIKKIRDDRIVYHGVVSNEEVVNAEIKASVLINPRPTTESFTKYSFPSKNMEYMVSGTPVLTTKLPGMPNEYLDYVFVLNDASVDEMAESIKTVLSSNEKDLFNMGTKAKEFVLREKNNCVQAKKMLRFIKML